MNGLDQHHDALLDRHLDQLDREDAQSVLADAERERLLDMVIQAQGALTRDDKEIAMCILNEIEKELS
jgi:16S rRNA C1402 N4-methylase RsmH